MTCRVPVSCRFALSTSWDYLALLGNPTIRISLGLSRNFKPADKQNYASTIYRTAYVPIYTGISEIRRNSGHASIYSADFARELWQITFRSRSKQNRKFVTNLGGKGNKETPFPLFPFPSPSFNTIEILLKCYYSSNNVIIFLQNNIVISVN